MASSQTHLAQGPHTDRAPRPLPLAATVPGATQTLKSPPSSLATSRSRTRKRTPNHISIQAASPQIISSLIDQLSAISIPANNHFENLLAGYDTFPSPTTPSFRSPSGRNSFTGQDGSALEQYHRALRDHSDLYSGEACESPVIRTCKPPSGLSPLTAPKKRDKPHSLTNYIGRSGGSSCSLHSVHSNRSASSFGNISIEATVPKDIPPDSNRSSLESKRSATAPRGLMYMSSRERLKQKETERRRVTAHTVDDASPLRSPKKAPSQLFPYEDTIKEEPTTKDDFGLQVPESSRLVPRFPSTNSSPRRLRINLVDGPDGETPSEKGIIPERGSSLGHTGSPPRKSKKRHSKDDSRRKTPETVMVPEQEGEVQVDQKSQLKERILEELEQEENDVAQRIRELKEQKRRRDLLAGKLPTNDVDAGATPSDVPHVSSLPSPELFPTSTTSDERKQDSTKAHKVLGIPTYPGATLAMAAESVERGLSHPKSEEATNPALLQVQNLRHLRHRSLTVNDGDDLTPLPINYALALQRLNEPRSPLIETFQPTSQLHNTSNASVVSNSSDGASVLKRSKSVAIGGRSAIGRRAATDSVIMGVATGHKRVSSSVTDSSSVSKLSTNLRSNSEDMVPRLMSMHASAEAAVHSMALQRRRTLTKKRWSHPDLPAKAEKEHNEKMERAEARSKSRAAAVQSPPVPSIEERPVSLDSIDIDVQSFLNSSRLSQKIRHPQTGRVISFSEVGDPQGYAVFVCVGMGLTRYVMAFYDQLALTLKLRLITPDRPGIGGSQIDPNATPLNWPDDVLVICQALKISKFSLLAHSAGAIYALATSLRMPQHIRGRVHLLAPWIPPSQMAPIGLSQASPPTQQLPRSQRFLRALPPSLLKVANATFLSATSASLQRTGPKNSTKARRKSIAPQAVQSQEPRPSLKENRRQSMMLMDQIQPNASSLTLTNPTDPNHEQRLQEALSLAECERQRAFDERLTFAIWDRATAHANPATDLMVCLETKQTIGFRYEDINRPVVIHHGSKDSRVPADNVRWLGKLMRKCEVRILDGEQHGLMASAQVMGNVLTEMAADWEDWMSMTLGKEGERKAVSRRRTAEKLRSQMSFSSMI
ncbi:hypothetical protein ACN47E_009321 [Coniothyrium glycines]